MYSEAKKLNLIEHLLKEKDEAILKSVEKILVVPKNTVKKFSDFKSKLTTQELDEFEKNIEEGCEQINESDWK